MMKLEPGDDAVWQRRLTVDWLWMASLILLAIGAAVSVLYPSWFVGLFVIVVTLPMCFLSRIVVQVDHRGLTIRYGPGWPATRIVHLTDRPRPRCRHPSPLVGRLGLPRQPGMFRRAALVLRGGPGLRLDLVNGSVFAVTIDDAETAAGLLSALIARQRTN